MRRFFVLCMALSLVIAVTTGCDQKTKTKVTDTVSDKGGTTTTEDTHTVTSSGNNPPTNAQGETGKQP
jgi:hypothetical protein